MTVLTWRNVDNPDFTGTISGVNNATKMLSDALMSANSGIEKFKDLQATSADAAINARALAYQDPEAYRQALADGSIVGDMASYASPEALKGLDSRVGALLDRATKEQTYEQTVYDNTRSRDGNALMDAAAPDIAQVAGLFRAGKMNEANQFIASNPRLQALRPGQLVDILKSMDSMASTGLTYRKEDYGFDKQVLNDTENRIADETAGNFLTRIANDQDALAVVSEWMNNPDPKQRPSNRMVMAVADRLGQKGFKVFGPLGSGTGAAPSGAGGASAPAIQAASAGGGITYTGADGKTMVYTGGTPAWRNNNAGNIRFGDWAQRNGAIGQDANGFAIFPSKEAGEKAHEAIIKNNYMDYTIEGMTAKYAPKGDGKNDPAAYAASLAKAIGVPVTTKLSDLKPEQFQKFLQAQRRFEGYQEGNVATASDASRAVQLLADAKGQIASTGLTARWGQLATNTDDINTAVSKAVESKMFPEGTPSGDLIGLVREVQQMSSGLKGPDGKPLPPVNAATALAMIAENRKKVGALRGGARAVWDTMFGSYDSSFSDGTVLDRDALKATVEEWATGGTANQANTYQQQGAAVQQVDDLRQQLTAAEQNLRVIAAAAQNNPRLRDSYIRAQQQRDAVQQRLSKALGVVGNTPGAMPQRAVTQTEGQPAGVAPTEEAKVQAPRIPAAQRQANTMDEWAATQAKKEAQLREREARQKVQADKAKSEKAALLEARRKENEEARRRAQLFNQYASGQ